MTDSARVRSSSCVLVGLLFAGVPLTGAAEVFGSGPSDPALFTNVIDVPPTPGPGAFDSVGGVAGETTQLNVLAGGSLGDGFDARSGAEVNVAGGSVGSFFDAFSGSEVNITAGTVGGSFNANAGSEVNVLGGVVGAGFDAFSGSVVNVRGGAVGDGFFAQFGSVVNVSGGSVGANFESTTNSVLNLSGGSVGDAFFAFVGTEVNVFGTEFLLDGVRLDGLALGESLAIADRDVTLSGTLADGSFFDFDLNTAVVDGADLFDPGAVLTVTRVPEPSALATLAAVGLALASLGRRERRPSVG